MRSNLTPVFPEVTLDRILDALERELVEATDAELLEAAEDLGMNPAMKGSAAFLGLKYPYRPQLEDFFANLTPESARLAIEQLVAEQLLARQPAESAPKSVKADAPRPRAPRGLRPRRDK